MREKRGRLRGGGSCVSDCLCAEMVGKGRTGEVEEGGARGGGREEVD